MSETNVDNVVELPAESDSENVETPNTALAVVGGTIIGVAAVFTAGFVIKKFQERKLRKNPIHVVTDLEDETATS